MITVRSALPEDAAELVRLRCVMFTDMNGLDQPGSWERYAQEQLESALGVAGASLGAFVVDAAPQRLAACAVGTIEERLAAPGHPTGRFGFLFNVCTDPAHRGRGYARAVTEALLDWFAARGVTRVDLHATPQAERLYRDFGFTEHPTALSLDVSGRVR